MPGGEPSAPPPGGPFRALSLDLWFTTYYHRREDEEGWDRARVACLREALVSPGGQAWSDDVLATSIRSVTARLDPHRWFCPQASPSVVVTAVAEELGARLRRPLAEVADAFSAAGLEDCPPRPNPEAVELVRTLRRRGVPTLLVTNTARSASTWVDFLRRHEGPEVVGVLASCDLGRGKPDPTIFLEAAHRLEQPLSKLLHVGDDFELDVVGPLGAGCGAALYRGLWDRYPDGRRSRATVPEAGLERALVIDRLDQLLRPDLWEARAASGGRPDRPT